MMSPTNKETYTDNETKIEKFIKRVENFDQIIDYLSLDGGLFYSSLDPDLDFFSSYTMDLPLSLWAHDEDNIVVYGNNLFREKFNKRVNQPCYECLMAEGRRCECCQSKRLSRQTNCITCSLCKRKETGYDINVCHSSITNSYGNKLFIKTSFHVDDAAAVYEEFYVNKRENSSEQFIITVCSGCHKVKYPGDRWVNIDEHVLGFFDGRISHGICLECIDNLYPDLNKSFCTTSRHTGS